MPARCARVVGMPLHTCELTSGPALLVQAPAAPADALDRTFSLEKLILALSLGDSQTFGEL